MGGTSAPMPCAQVAATGRESIGTQVPPTKAKVRAKARRNAAVR
ncbi:DUF6053 domain-containing protein [Lysobacter enzymogenes]